MIAEVRGIPEGSRYIDLYPGPSCLPWTFDLDDWTSAVHDAENQLR